MSIHAIEHLVNFARDMGAVWARPGTRFAAIADWLKARVLYMTNDRPANKKNVVDLFHQRRLVYLAFGS